MNILSPTKSECLTISEYIQMMSDKNFNQNVVRMHYHINHDWNSADTGCFSVEYGRPALRKKKL
jgi:hypothetical protein